ncbi:hypothetical protein [Nocardia sp. CA-135398]|uniref:hypothetical protein n=1 Tax=Nocardia sp. CA-135398 TaxID=3239977 RepID=UPI003D977D3A
MDDGATADAARLDLARVAAIGEGVRTGALWLPGYFAALGIGSLIAVPVLGTLDTGIGSIVANSVWTAFVGGCAAYGFRRRAFPYGARRRYVRTTLIWAALWLSAVVLGGAWSLPGLIMAGVLVSLPMLTAAHMEAAR